jgi:hypothetical protein
MTLQTPLLSSPYITQYKLYGQQQNTVHSYAFLQRSFTGVITNIGVVLCCVVL